MCWVAECCFRAPGDGVVARRHPPRDAVGEHTGLAGPGSRHDAARRSTYGRARGMAVAFPGHRVRFAANVVHAEAAERTEQPLGVNRARDSRIARGDALRRMQ